MKNQFPRILRRIACIASAAFLLVACTTGVNFPAQRSQEFILGQTTKADVVRMFGPAVKEETETHRKSFLGKNLSDTVVLTSLYYVYSEPSGQQAVASGFRPSRRAWLYFHHGRLVGYFRSSNFAADSTRFDVAKASALAKGKTTEKDVIAAFGDPSGRGIYPLSATQDGRSLFYKFLLPNHPPGSTTFDSLAVDLAADGVVQDFTVSSQSKVNPVAPTPVTIPIYIPRRR